MSALQELSSRLPLCWPGIHNGFLVAAVLVAVLVVLLEAFETEPTFT